MSYPGWQTPITALPGQAQTGVDPLTLLPGRQDLWKARLEFQRSLILGAQRRLTPVLVTPDGVIYDGHHWSELRPRKECPWMCWW
jgi:hypothetical protein